MSENLAKYNVIVETFFNVKGTEETKKNVGLLQKQFDEAKKKLIELGSIAAITAIGKQIFETTAKFQGYESVLKNTLGSQQEAEKALNLIKDTAKGTVFSVDELTASYLKFANRGIKLTGAEITKLADIAASQGKSFDQLTEAVLDAQTGEFERLKEFGISASKSGDQVSLTFKGVTQTIKNTPEAINALITSYGDLQGVQGSNITQMETLNGRMSNIGDTVDELFVKIGKALLPVFNFLLDVVVSVVAGLSTLANILISIPKFIQENAAAFYALGVAVVSFNIPLILSTTLMIKNTIASKAKAAADLFLATKTGLLTRAQWLLNAAFAANPIGLIVAAVALLVAGFVLLYNKSETVRNIFAGIANVAKSLVNIFKDVGDSITKTFSGGFLDGLKNIGTSIIDGIKKSFSDAFSDLENIVNGEDVAASALRLAKKVLNIMTFGLSGALTDAGKFVVDSFTKGFDGDIKITSKIRFESENHFRNIAGLKALPTLDGNIQETARIRQEILNKRILDLESENEIIEKNIARRKKAGLETLGLEKNLLENQIKLAKLRSESKASIDKKEFELELLGIKNIKDAGKDKEETQEEINKKLFKIEKDKIDKEFALREKAAREAISDAKKLGEELEKLEVQKQIALAAKKQNIYTDDFVEIGNQIDELSRKYNSLSRVKVDPLDLLPRKTTEKILKNAKSIGEALRFLKFNIDTTTDGATKLKLQKELDNFVKQLAGGDIKDKIKELQDEFEITFNPKIKIDIKKKIKDLENELSIFQSPEFRKKLFISDGQIDITDLLPKDQVDAIEERLKIVKEKIKNIGKIDSITELNQFDKLKDEAAKLKEYLDKLGMNDGGFIQNLLGLSDEDFTKFQKDLENAFNIAKDSLNQILESEIEATDQRIELQQERVNSAEKIAEKGNVKQLELEEERLTKLQEKREKFVAAQRILSQLEILQSNAVAAAKSIEAISTAFAAGGPAGIITGIATSIALAAQIGAIVSTVRNSFGDLPAFFEGTELISADHRFRGNKVTNGRDGYVFRGDGTERMVEGAINSKLNGFPNALLPDAVKLYQMQSTTVPKIIAIGGKSDDTMIKEIQALRESFENTRTSITLDKKGLAIQIDKMIQKNIQRKRFTA